MTALTELHAVDDRPVHDETANRPIEDGYCYQCGWDFCRPGRRCLGSAHPETLAQAALNGVCRMAPMVGNLEESLDRWAPGDVALARAIAAQLAAWADTAEFLFEKADR